MFKFNKFTVISVSIATGLLATLTVIPKVEACLYKCNGIIQIERTEEEMKKLKLSAAKRLNDDGEFEPTEVGDTWVKHPIVKTKFFTVVESKTEDTAYISCLYLKAYLKEGPLAFDDTFQVSVVDIIIRKGDSWELKMD